MGVKEGFGPALWAVYTLPSHCDQRAAANAPHFELGRLIGSS